MLRLVSLVIIVIITLGCGDTVWSRKSVSRRTRELSAIVQAHPKTVEADTALLELIDILNSDCSFAKCQACSQLGALGAAASPAIPDLIRLASSKQMYCAQEAIHALSQMGPTAAPAVDLFIESVEAGISHPWTGLSSIYSAEGLGNIGEPALKGIPTLEKAIHSQDTSLAHAASESLEKLTKLRR